MSKRYRNSIKDKARRKRDPLPVRAIGYMPQGKPGGMPTFRADEKHYERRKRSLRADRNDAA